MSIRGTVIYPSLALPILHPRRKLLLLDDILYHDPQGKHTIVKIRRLSVEACLVRNGSATTWHRAAESSGPTGCSGLLDRVLSRSFIRSFIITQLHRFIKKTKTEGYLFTRLTN
jgi:hypothetical protein